MSNLLDDGVYIAHQVDYDEYFVTQWCSLFQRCFKASRKTSLQVFEKYKLNNSRICYSIKNGIMVAAYGGLKLNFENVVVFLSTDTMSDGTLAGASIRLGRNLYKSLSAENVLVACGYPNNNIREIRERGLGWTMHGKIFLYIGVPFFWRLNWRSKTESLLWKVMRPKNGWFIRRIPFINLLGRDGLYSSRAGFVVTMKSTRPGFFFLKIPGFVVEPRYFGYKFLSDDQAKQKLFIEQIAFLDIDTIDIP